jgi:ABC-2 type transport system permease protein
MFTLFIKELSGFFSSLTGYVVIAVFLITNSLFLWVFPGDYNIIDRGFAGLDTLFFLAPWIFLFLVPAVTMRFFSDEQRSGTIELLFTRPLTRYQIILAKYFAGIVLVLFSLLPTLVYFVTVGIYGKPAWNLDTGAFWGSLIGLFFLAAVYVAIGVFASALSKNQIIAFLVAVLMSFFFFVGFEAVSTLEFWGHFGNVIDKLGINAHYKSVSRGVVDTRDVVYFLAVGTVFVFSTKVLLDKKL